MATWSSVDVCGIQVNDLDCLTGAPLTGDDNVSLSCNVVDYSRSATLTAGATDQDPSGRSQKFCARRIVDPRVDFWEYTFTLCSAFDARLMDQLGLVDAVFDPADPTRCIGVKDRDWRTDSEDGCCPSEDGCTSSEVSMYLWSLAWCGDERHPEFLYDVHIVPRLKFRVTSDSVDRGTGFRTMTISARTSYPRTDPATGNSVFGSGPGGLYIPGDLGVQWANMLTNTPFPLGCDCGSCFS